MLGYSQLMIVPAPVGEGGHSVALGRGPNDADTSSVMVEYGSVFGGMVVVEEDVAAGPLDVTGAVDGRTETEVDVGHAVAAVLTPTQ